MKPILYASTETNFDTNGLGILGDCISCVITQERNGMFELEMEYPVSGIHYEDIALRAILMALPDPISRPQPFRIYEISRPMDGAVTVYARHIAYDLAGIPVTPFSTSTAAGAMEGLKANAAADCPFSFWTDKTTAANMTVTTPTPIWSLLGGSRGGILDVYGGEYEFDLWTVKLHSQRGANRGVTIRYGKNLTDLTQEQNCEAVYTGVYPYWANSDGGIVQLPEKIVSAPGTYDFTRILTLDLSDQWENAPTVSQLRERATAYIKTNAIGVPKVSLELSFVQLEQSQEYKNIALLERVSLCDTVNVEFPRLGVSASAKCVKIVFDALAERYDRVELGDAKTNLADIIANQSAEIQQSAQQMTHFLLKAVANATNQITGNLGGYVVLHSSTGGKTPDEILVMDTPDVATAKNIWRWNKSGFGHSSNGYNGPFSTAITQDGKIVADYITAGKLSTALLNVAEIFAQNITATGLIQFDNRWYTIKSDTTGNLQVRSFGDLTLAGEGTLTLLNQVGHISISTPGGVYTDSARVEFRSNNADSNRYTFVVDRHKLIFSNDGTVKWEEVPENDLTTLHAQYDSRRDDADHSH